MGSLSAAIGAYGTNLIQQAEATKDWPTTQGKIIVSEIRPGKDDGSSRPLVRFQYGLRGTIYRSEQYRQNTAGEPMKKAAAEELIKKYPVGAPVRVYYDPENPVMAVLEQGDPTLGYLVCSAAVVLLGVVSVVAIQLRKKGK